MREEYHNNGFITVEPVDKVYAVIEFLEYKLEESWFNYMEFEVNDNEIELLDYQHDSLHVDELLEDFNIDDNVVIRVVFDYATDEGAGKRTSTVLVDNGKTTLTVESDEYYGSSIQSYHDADYDGLMFDSVDFSPAGIQQAIDAGIVEVGEDFDIQEFSEFVKIDEVFNGLMDQSEEIVEYVELFNKELDKFSTL